MRLKNKKTGEIIGIVIVDHGAEWEIRNMCTDEVIQTYNSLAELNAEWEDVLEEPIQVYLEGIQEVHSGGGRVFIDYATPEEAKKAVEKLKAWKRLKDNSFRFTDLRFEYDELSGTIKFRTNLYGGINDDLDLLFGGGDV